MTSLVMIIDNNTGNLRIKINSPTVNFKVAIGHAFQQTTGRLSGRNSNVYVKLPLLVKLLPKNKTQ